MATVSGCSASIKPVASVSRVLPEPPPFLAPVALPVIARGADARMLLGRYRLQLVKANRRLADGRTWYMKTVSEYQK